MKKVVFASLLSILTPVWAEDMGGLKTSVSVDTVAQAGLKENSGASDTLIVRGAEVMLYAPADHNWDGAMSIAAHNEGGIGRVELHEAYFGSTKLIPRSRFRVGQYFLGIGRLNQFHQHDWPFITAPKVHQQFFADEGVLDTGLEYTYLLPVPVFLEVTAGVTNGFTFGHDHSAGARPLLPTHYVRAVTYAGLPWEGGTQIGLNYLGRRGNEGNQMTLLGVDVTAKWKEATVTQFLLQSELWYQSQTPSGADTQRKFGLYVYPQYYLGENLFAGLRFDYFTFLNEKDVDGIEVKNFDLNFVPTLTYRSSEFMQIRLAYNHGYVYRNTGYGSPISYFELQGVFILGAHPAHDF